MKMNELRELLEYNVVADALGHIFNHFGDPLYDRDPNLIQGMHYLVEYCMSKKIGKDIVDESISREMMFPDSFGSHSLNTKWTLTREDRA